MNTLRKKGYKEARFDTDEILEDSPPSFYESLNGLSKRNVIKALAKKYTNRNDIDSSFMLDVPEKIAHEMYVFIGEVKRTPMRFFYQIDHFHTEDYLNAVAQESLHTKKMQVRSFSAYYTHKILKKDCGEFTTNPLVIKATMLYSFLRVFFFVKCTLNKKYVYDKQTESLL